MFNKVLVANRGEIAVRVFRAAREMGIRTVAVYSDADAKSRHVQVADEAVWIGGSAPSESYLDITKVIDAAKSVGADAIHPGYGFLSERAEFVEACEAAGIAFIGPSAHAMRSLGSKIDAKQLAVKAQVPVTPGFFELGADATRLKQAADEIGYPVMLKASAGGGGRGMRIVRDPAQFEAEFEIASDEALKGFGDGAMMVEKLIEQPRHIEVQFIADSKGNVACLFERECSLQRRHQKLVEEAPSTVLDEPQWQSLREAVERLVREAEYVNAGTAEFIFDGASGNVYFLEVNARLQVEHPVTELITGVDLVQWQLRVASGESLDERLLNLPLSRNGIRGHAIEARIVAEDPAMGFMPSIGPILGWAEPQAPGVRVDTGFGPGSEVSRFYDSLIAKVIVHGETREQAIRRLEQALLDFHIIGVKTNIAYLLDVIRHPSFGSGEFDTGFLGREFGDWKPSSEVPRELGDILAASKTVASGGSAPSTNDDPAWGLLDGWRVTRIN